MTRSFFLSSLALLTIASAACRFEGYSKRKPRVGMLGNHEKMDDIKACEDGDLEGCYEAGKRLCYLTDQGVRTDHYEPHSKYPNTGYYDGADCNEGAYRLEYACDEGHGPSCFLAAKLVLDSNSYRGDDEDRREYAHYLLRDGCEEGDKSSCELLRSLALRVKWYYGADWAGAKVCEIEKCYPGAEAGPSTDLLKESSTIGLIGGGYGTLSEGDRLNATESYFFDGRTNFNMVSPDGSDWFFLSQLKARIGVSDVSGLLQDGSVGVGLARRLGHLALGLQVGLGMAIQADEDEPSLGTGFRLPLIAQAQYTYGRFALVGQAEVGASSGRWQDGSPNAPTGDYLSTDLTLVTPPFFRAYGKELGLGLTLRYDEFGGIQMYSFSIGAGIAEGEGYHAARYR